MAGQQGPGAAPWSCPGCGRRGVGGGPGLGRGRGRGRLFDGGELRLLILALLAERPRHGYELIKALEEKVGGGYSPSPGVVYPTLTLLEELGQAVVSEERAGRKLFTLTGEGRAALAQSRPALDAVLARIESGAASRAGPPPEVLRAMQNLAAALQLRLQRGPAGAAELRAITAAIDAAARAVESA